MPNSKKRPAKSGTKILLSNGNQKTNPGFDPKQCRLPKGLKNHQSGGGKPKLFPGRTGGR